VKQPRPVAPTAVWTIPNAISALRIVLIVVFAVLIASHRDGWAIAALAGAGVSDFVDGYLARRWNQVTALGRVLDPAADRLLTIAVVLGLALRSIIPWWLVAILLLRDVVVGAALLYGRRTGVDTPQVTRIGKWATAGLYFFLPLAYLAFDRWTLVHGLAIVGATAAAGPYWVAGIGYVRDVQKRARIRAVASGEGA
jgi:cardiolipin synthase